MENKVIYVPVSVQEELPPIDIETDMVLILIDKDGLMCTGEMNQDGVFYSDYDSSEVIENVTHWLKRIELPGEEDVRLELVKKYPKLDISYSSDRLLHHARETFVDGAKYILSIINQKK